MHISIVEWLLTTLMCLGTAVRVSARDTKVETQDERTEEADQTVRELHEAAPEAEQDRETFGDRFKRGDLFGYFDAQGRFFPQPATSAVSGLPMLNNYWFNGSLGWE